MKGKSTGRLHRPHRRGSVGGEEGVKQGASGTGVEFKMGGERDTGKAGSKNPGWRPWGGKAVLCRAGETKDRALGGRGRQGAEDLTGKTSGIKVGVILVENKLLGPIVRKIRGGKSSFNGVAGERQLCLDTSSCVAWYEGWGVGLGGWGGRGKRVVVGVRAGTGSRRGGFLVCTFS